MLKYNFILPTSGSITLDGTIIIAIATIFAVTYLYINRCNLKSNEINLESNMETNTLTNRVISETSVKEEVLEENIQETSRNPNLIENQDEPIDQPEKIKIHN